MTIKAEWLHVWKNESAAAFTPKCQHPIDVAFIDGQIKLMKAWHVTTWKDLIYWNFASPIKKYLQAGASTVVLAFDNYAYVPTAKGMTQAKRIKHVPMQDPHKNATLPPNIPHNWEQCLMNRAFKTKVIRLITETLPKLLVGTLQKGQRIIIDHENHPVQYTAEGEPAVLDDLQPLGEADVKFARYTSIGNMLIEATDGDYVPIALMQIERAKREGKPLHHISIYRMEINLKGPKRTAAGDIKHMYEHLHVNELYTQLVATILLKLGKREERLGAASGAQMSVIAALIAYTGCDFSKGLPYISPKRIWDNLGLIWTPTAAAFSTESGTLDVATMADRVVARLYLLAYKNHVKSDRLGMKDVAEQLKRKSALSDTIKNRLPEATNVECVVRNANWVILYWSCAAHCPDPMAGGYGFTRDAKGKPTWSDEARPTRPDE